MKKTLALLAAALVSACSGDSGGSGTPPPPSPAEPNDTFETASAITLGTAVAGKISVGVDTAGAVPDLDYYRFQVPAGGAKVRFQTFDSGGTQCDPANAAVDPIVYVYDPSLALAAFQDDFDPATTYCEDLTVTLPAGTAYVRVSGWEPTPFDYVLKTTIVP